MPSNSKDENKKKVVKLQYVAKTKRSYLNRTFPAKSAEGNIVEINESLVDTFLRMKIGKDRLWKLFKEPKAKKELETETTPKRDNK